MELGRTLESGGSVVPVEGRLPVPGLAVVAVDGRLVLRVFVEGRSRSREYAKLAGLLLTSSGTLNLKTSLTLDEKERACGLWEG